MTFELPKDGSDGFGTGDVITQANLEANFGGIEAILNSFPSGGSNGSGAYAAGSITYDIIDFLSTEIDLDEGSGALNTKVPSQLAVKTYVDTQVATKEDTIVDNAAADLCSAWRTKDTGGDDDLALDTIYKAECTGFLVVKYGTASNTTILIKSGAASPPTATRAWASSNGIDSPRYMTLTCPIIKDHYVQTTSDVAIESISWVGFGSGGLVAQAE